MIEDDFESVLRKMLEQFMEAFDTFSEGNGTIKSWTGSFVNEPLESTIEPMNNEPNVEKIDLGDSILFLIQGHFDSAVEPRVKVEGQNIIVTFGSETKDIQVESGFPIDLEKSNVSYRNGVIEITAVKAENYNESEGYLKIE